MSNRVQTISNRMENTAVIADAFFAMVGSIMLSFVRRVAPFAVPVSPATFFGAGVHKTVSDLTGSDSLALAVGIISALGLESAGIMASHVAIKLFDLQEKGKAIVAVVMTVFYLMLGIVGIYLFKDIGDDAKVIGIVMFLIAGVVYICTALIDYATAVERERRLEAEVIALAEAEKKTAQAEADAEAAQDERDRKAAQDEHDRQKDLLLLEDELKRKRQKEAHDQSMEAKRLEAKAKSDQLKIQMLTTAQTAVQSDGEAVSENGHLPSQKTRWPALSDDEQRALIGLSPLEIRKRYPLISESSSRRWKKYANELKGQVTVQMNGHGKKLNGQMTG